MPIKLVTKNLKINAWILCHQTLNSLIKCEEKVFAPKGLTPNQFKILMAIKEQPTPVTQIDLAYWLDCNHNTISLILDRMAMSGLIKKGKS
jgi:DNA-binding MarR family transcriptional regulator